MDRAKEMLLMKLDSIKAKKPKVNRGKLMVFYGWAKLNKIRKKEAISVIFTNEDIRDDKLYRSLAKHQETVYERAQTELEKEDAAYSNRVFTEYSIFMDDKDIAGSLERALQVNFNADKNHVSEKERNEIKACLRRHFLSTHINYKEPTGYQLALDLE